MCKRDTESERERERQKERESFYVIHEENVICKRKKKCVHVYMCESQRKRRGRERERERERDKNLCFERKVFRNVRVRKKCVNVWGVREKERQTDKYFLCWKEKEIGECACGREKEVCPCVRALVR